MLFLFGFLLLMGAVDSLNPSTIIVLVLLLSMLENVNRVAIYVAGIWIAYFVGGIAVFTGFSTVAGYLAEQFALIPDFVLYGLEGLLGISLIVYGMLEWRKQGGQKQVAKSVEVSTWALIVLGVGGTLGDLPTAIPYLGFIAKMTEMRVSLLTGVGFLIGYCLVYIFPLLVLWGLYVKFQNQIKDKTESIVRRIESTSRTIMVAFGGIAGAILMFESVLFFFGIPVRW
jgi:cytochrome c biogenesis protein CcdA